MKKSEIIIKGKNSGYYATDNGDIISKSGNVLSKCTNSEGYIIHTLSIHKTKCAQRAHRLVWMAFNGDIPNKMVVNHKDSDKTNNKLSNLNLMTDSENKRHAAEAGAYSTKKITEDTAIKIIEQLKNDVPMTKIAENLNVTRRQVRAISENRTFKKILR